MLPLSKWIFSLTPIFVVVIADEGQGNSIWMADLRVSRLGDFSNLFTGQARSPCRIQYVLWASDHWYCFLVSSPSPKWEFLLFSFSLTLHITHCMYWGWTSHHSARGLWTLWSHIWTDRIDGTSFRDMWPGNLRYRLDKIVDCLLLGKEWQCFSSMSTLKSVWMERTDLVHVAQPMMYHKRHCGSSLTITLSLQHYE